MHHNQTERLSNHVYSFLSKTAAYITHNATLCVMLVTANV